MSYKISTARRRRKRKADRERKRQRRLDAAKILGGKCAECGSTEDLQFDHIDQSEKAERPTDLWSRRWEFVITVLWKFQLLCESCHDDKTTEGSETSYRRERPLKRHDGTPYKYDDEAVPSWVTED